LVRPRLLLIPGLSELEWQQIVPQLQEWADVLSFDPPGVGDTPGSFGRDATVAYALDLLDRQGWDSFVLAADGWQIGYAVGVLQARPAGVRALALGHASLSNRMTGERPPMNGEVYSAFRTLVEADHRAFAKYGIAQLTQEGFDEELAGRMVERLPASAIQEHVRAIGEQWNLEPFLRRLSVPLLFGQHEGCLLHSDEGFEDAIAAFPDARSVPGLSEPCCVSPAFAEALRELCAEL
jgi:pimeloyl-ACP methyl ester carboxylesterase